MVMWLCNFPGLYVYMVMWLLFQESLAKVDKQVRDARVHQTISRQHAIADWYIIKNNNTSIQQWSVVMVSIIVATAALQAYFVRRLFATPPVQPGAKPRA